MALVSDIQLQNGSITPPKLDTTLKYTVAGLSATTGITIGEIMPISLSGFFTIKSANDVAAHYETTKANGTVDLYFNNDSGVDWNLKLSGTSVDTLSIATVSGEQTGRRTHFSIKPAGHIGFGTLSPSNTVLAEFVALDAASASLKLNNSVDNTTMEWKAETASGSIGTTTSSNFGLRRGGVTIATVVSDGIHPTVDGTNDLGTTAIRWKHIYCDDITSTNTSFGDPIVDPNANYNLNDTYGLWVGHSAQITTINANEFQVIGTASADSSATFSQFSATTDGADLQFLKSRHASLGSNTAVTTGDDLGNISSFGADGTDFATIAARITLGTEGTIATGQVPGTIKMATAAAGTLVNALTINSAQEIGIIGGGLEMHIGATLKMLVAASTVWSLGWWQSSDNRWWLLGNTADVSSFSRANAEFYIPTADINDVPAS